MATGIEWEVKKGTEAASGKASRRHRRTRFWDIIQGRYLKNVSEGWESCASIVDLLEHVGHPIEGEGVPEIGCCQGTFALQFATRVDREQDTSDGMLNALTRWLNASGKGQRGNGRKAPVALG